MKGLNLITYEGRTVAKLYGTVAKLYGTVVAVITENEAKFCHGGFITRSTCKAINAAILKSRQNLTPAKIKEGILYVNGGMVYEKF